MTKAQSDRRAFLQLAAGAALGAAALPPGVAKALALPANRVTGTIRDVEHVVILMQENRSFDHYFGTMRGVRGYGDPRPIDLPSGQPVWKQPAKDAPTFKGLTWPTCAERLQAAGVSWRVYQEFN
ncbi:MAG TPA: alkaline phosphatase family protein, partial [Phenylobacterium sp.]|nr:alkaline phosphatase family protein [Phenylobacterium sp.]